jgi:hypothetical protein
MRRHHPSSLRATKSQAVDIAAQGIKAKSVNAAKVSYSPIMRKIMPPTL